MLLQKRNYQVLNTHYTQLHHHTLFYLHMKSYLGLNGKIQSMQSLNFLHYSI